MCLETNFPITAQLWVFALRYFLTGRYHGQYRAGGIFHQSVSSTAEHLFRPSRLPAVGSDNNQPYIVVLLKFQDFFVGHSRQQSVFNILVTAEPFRTASLQLLYTAPLIWLTLRNGFLHRDIILGSVWPLSPFLPSLFLLYTQLRINGN